MRRLDAAFSSGPGIRLGSRPSPARCIRCPGRDLRPVKPGRRKSAVKPAQSKGLAGDFELPATQERSRLHLIYSPRLFFPWRLGFFAPWRDNLFLVLRRRLGPGESPARLTISGIWVSHSMAWMCTPRTPAISRTCWISSTAILMAFLLACGCLGLLLSAPALPRPWPCARSARPARARRPRSRSMYFSIIAFFGAR